MEQINKYKKMVIFFAGMTEAKPLINHSGIKFNMISDIEFKSEDKKIDIFITGIGKYKLIEFFEKKQLQKGDFTLYIKAGTCGILNNNISLLSTIVPCQVNIIEGQQILLKTYKQTAIFKLVTVDAPVTSAEQKTLLNGYDLVDMESYYIAQKVKSLMVICVGTDYADKIAITDFKKNIKLGSELIKQEILEIIGNLID